jgi:hypothetical protein
MIGACNLRRVHSVMTPAFREGSKHAFGHSDSLRSFDGRWLIHRRKQGYHESNARAG